MDIYRLWLVRSSKLDRKSALWSWQRRPVLKEFDSMVSAVPDYLQCIVTAMLFLFPMQFQQNWYWEPVLWIYGLQMYRMCSPLLWKWPTALKQQLLPPANLQDFRERNAMNMTITIPISEKPEPLRKRLFFEESRVSRIDRVFRFTFRPTRWRRRWDFP